MSSENDFDTEDDAASAGYPAEAFEVRPLPMAPGFRLRRSMADVGSIQERALLERRRKDGEKQVAEIRAKAIAIVERKEELAAERHRAAAKVIHKAKSKQSGGQSARRGTHKPRKQTWREQGINGIPVAQPYHDAKRFE